MEINIYVPNMDWLIGGSRIGGDYNRYYGSLGSDGKLGAYGRKIFNYTVWLEKLDEQEILKAAVYYGLKSFDNTAEEDIETEVFEPEQDSIPVIKAWITEKAREFFME
ncbi:MAG: hypothetical protein NC122_05160 [Faecalibacterium sp.]|nr:hypothetical protein [Ruminococcus sp.]MCM1391994.1 hypothetical protein [Ruminococcus sp.]MCM1485575.1 hypothetical protein [Faecalibacterium sp.]